MAGTNHFFISDAHLGSRLTKPDEREQKLVDFCEHIAPSAKTLFLMGDLFDFWFEYRRAVPAEHFRVLAAFHRLVRQGTAVVYVAGNHDFWRGDFLTRQVGITLHPEALTLTLDNRRVRLMHGDGLTEKGWRTPLFKRLSTNRFNQALYRCIPPDLGIPFAKWISSLSRSHVEKTLDIGKVVDRYRNGAAALLEREPVDAVVMGHTHRADLQDFAGKTYVNCGNWMKTFDYAVLENGSFRITRFSS